MKSFYTLMIMITLASAGLFVYQTDPSSDSLSLQKMEKKKTADTTSSTNTPKRPAVVAKEGSSKKEAPKTKTSKGSSARVLAVGISAKLVDDLITDTGFPGASAGDVLEYTVTLTNAGSTPALNVIYTQALDPNTTLVPGSIKGGAIAIGDTYNTIGNVGLSIPVGSGVLKNDVTLDNSAITITSSLNITTALGGTVVMAADGSFTYAPKVGVVGNDSFSYSIKNGTGVISNGMVNIAVANRIWFVNAGAAQAGDGTLAKPFNSITALNSVNGIGTAPNPQNGDVIFVYSGAYSEALILRDNQKVIGQGSTETILAISGYTTPSGTNLLPATGGTRPTWTTSGTIIHALTVKSGNRIQGLDIGVTSGKKIIGGSYGTLTIKDVSLKGTGPALDLSGGTLAASFDEISGSSSNVIPVNITSSNGNLAIATGTLTASSVSALNISGTASNNRIALTGNFVAINANGGTKGIVLSNTSGTFKVTGSGTTAGSGGTIQNITLRGAEFVNADGITLSNMNFTNANTTEGVVVSNMDNSGANAAIHANTANGFNLNNIAVSGTIVQEGINLRAVNAFKLDKVTVSASGSGTGSEEGNLYAVNSTGNCSISNSTFSDPKTRVVYVGNNNINLSQLTVTNSTFQNSVNGAGLLFDGQGTSVMNLLVEGTNQFLNCQTDGIEVYANNTSKIQADIKGATINPGANVGNGLDLSASGSATLKFNILNNTITSNDGPGINLFPGTNGYMEGTIDGNKVYQLTGSGSGIAYTPEGASARGIVKISNNTITDVGGSGIRLSQISTANPGARSDFNILNNSISLTGINTLYNIDVVNPNTAEANNAIACVNWNGNIIPSVGNAGMIRVRPGATNSQIILQGSGSDVVTNWNSNSNTFANATQVSNPTGGVTAFGGTCLNPSVPLLVTPAARVAEMEETISSQRTAPVDEPMTRSGSSSSSTPKVAENKNASAAKVAAGETVTIDNGGSGFTLPSGSTVQVKFSATINNSIVADDCELSTQGAVSGSNFTTINTDDPDQTGSANPTTTQLQTAPVITCPANITADPDAGGCTATLSPVATATGCPEPTLTYSIAGTTITFPYAFPEGTTTVDVIAQNGNAPDATCSFTVTVNPLIALGTQGVVCDASNNFYTVHFNAPAGAAISTDKGTVSASSVINIPSDQQVTITATAGACTKTLIQTKNCSLPVTLISINAKAIENTVRLDWKTSMETNSDRFELERSRDGKQWNLVGTVQSHQESVKEQTYFFEDRMPLAGENLYRLKMIDLDGTFAYSRIVNAVIKGSVEALKLFPNPASHVLNIEVPEWSEVSDVEIRDVAGKLIYHAGHKISKTVDLKSFADGAYILVIRKNNGEVETKKFVINK